MNNTIKEIKQHFELLGYYKKVVYAEHSDGIVYFHAIDSDDDNVLLRADVQDNKNYEEWDLWECYDEHDWTFVN